MARILACLILVAVLPACRSATEVDEGKLVDLSYAFDRDTIYWPTARSFELDQVAHGPNARGKWYASNDFAASEHGGTHLDAPVHFAEGRRTTDEIPLRELVGPARVIDVRAACAQDPDYLVTRADLEAHEWEHGRIPRGAIVLIHTGWGSRWPIRRAYLGSDEPGKTDDLHFPGLGVDAAAALVERRVDLVGIDTASLDHGPSVDFEAHRVLSAADIPGLENVANLDRLPPTGATVLALPMKIAGGTGGPCRIVALLP